MKPGRFHLEEKPQCKNVKEVIFAQSIMNQTKTEKKKKRNKGSLARRRGREAEIGNSSGRHSHHYRESAQQIAVL